MKKLHDWETEEYYEIAGEASNDMDHPAMIQLIKLAKKSKSILDLGCGDGTRLNNLKTNARKTGIDISKTAINKARKKYKNINLKIGNLEKLPFEKNQFDLTYSAYVLEHTVNPEKILKQAHKVLKKNGKLLLVCPNFGAPNRSSPPARYTRLSKLLSGLHKDLFDKSDNLNWQKVKPLSGKYFPDSDTTIEPYLRSIEKYFKFKLNMRIIKKSSCWSEELPDAKLHQKLFRVLSSLNIYPFYYWGPHMYIIAEK